MNRNAAIVVLAMFGFGFLAIAWWGGSELLAAQSAMEAKVCPVVIDTSAFWFVGCGALALVLLCAVTSRPRLQNAIIAASIILFVAAPVLLFAWFSGVATMNYYAADGFETPFMLERVVLRNGACSESDAP